jgi:hypothetical protein
MVVPETPLILETLFLLKSAFCHPKWALVNGKDALAAWLKAAVEAGRDIPEPGAFPAANSWPEYRAVYTPD